MADARNTKHKIARRLFLQKGTSTQSSDTTQSLSREYSCYPPSRRQQYTLLVLVDPVRSQMVQSPRCWKPGSFPVWASQAPSRLKRAEIRARSWSSAATIWIKMTVSCHVAVVTAEFFSVVYIGGFCAHGCRVGHTVQYVQRERVYIVQIYSYTLDIVLFTIYNNYYTK